MPTAGLAVCSIRSSACGCDALRCWRTAMGDDDRPSMEGTFTLDEANAAVVQLRPVVEEMVEHRRRLAGAQRRQAELVTRIAGNGGDMQPSDLREVAAEIQAEADGIAQCAERISGVGAQI